MLPTIALLFGLIANLSQEKQYLQVYKSHVVPLEAN